MGFLFDGWLERGDFDVFTIDCGQIQGQAQYAVVLFVEKLWISCAKAALSGGFRGLQHSIQHLVLALD
jgi:hypothetical protein